MRLPPSQHHTDNDINEHHCGSNHLSLNFNDYNNETDIPTKIPPTAPHHVRSPPLAEAKVVTLIGIHLRVQYAAVAHPTSTFASARPPPPPLLLPSPQTRAFIRSMYVTRLPHIASTPFNLQTTPLYPTPPTSLLPLPHSLVPSPLEFRQTLSIVKPVC